MIPPEAIKPIISKGGRDSTELAVGTLIAYRVVPQTQEGIDKAKKIIANSKEWLVPSTHPEYYNDIDSDLMAGKETPGILAIQNHLKEFYGLTTPSVVKKPVADTKVKQPPAAPPDPTPTPSAGTQDFVDTRVEKPATTKEKKKNNLKPKPYAKDNIDRWSRLTGYELDSLSDYTRDQLRALASKYGIKRYSSYKDKNELAKVIQNTVAYQQAAPKAVEKKVEKVKLPKPVEQPSAIKIPQAHYIQGQRGRWEPEFENDIDHAVYYAGKSPIPKGDKQREVLAWLKSLGLTYEQIHDHREKVLEKMRDTIAVPGVEEEYPYLYIDAVDQDFVIEDDDEFDETEDDIEDLDDLLNLVRTDDDTSEEEVAENIEEEILDAAGEDKDDEEEGDFGSEDDIPDELLQDEVDPELLEKLLVTINKPKKESNYTSNKKIFDSIVVNFGRLQSTLDTINNNLEKQNSLIKANIDTQLAIGELVSNQTDLLGEKFDAILKEFQKQSERAKDLADEQERGSAEDSLEGQRDAAGVSDFQDLTKKPSGKKRENKIEKYLRGKLTRKLYRKLPKSVRNVRQKVRKLQRLPDKAKAKAVSKITSMLPTKGKQAVGTMSKIRGMGSVGRMAGPARYAFAGLEYGERKAEGQSELQAQAGVGSGLAGASLSAGLVSAGIALLPTAPTGWGAVAAGSLILLGSALGGSIASGAADRATGADKVTGAHETGTGLTKPGTALLHGTEAVINPNAMSPMSSVGGLMIAATTGYINSAGAVAAPIAPVLKGISAQMAKQYDVPSTLTQTNVGGSLPNISGELKKVKEKRKQTPGEELSGMEKDLLETQDPQSFADKLLKMLDPEGKFQQLLQQINHQPPEGDPTLTEGGYATFGETGSGSNAKGWVHGHFQNPTSEAELLRDTFPFVKKLLEQGSEVVITGGVDRPLNKDMDDATIKDIISKGIGTHSNRTKGYYAVDVSVKKGTKVPFALEDVRDAGGREGVRGKIPGTNTFIGHLTGDSKSGGPESRPTKSTGDFDVIIPLDHVKPGNENKIPDKKGGNTFKNASATGAAGRERDHQDKAAAKVKAKLEAKGLRVKVITPEDFGNYEDYDNYITTQASKNVRIVPLHFDAAVGQGGTGFLTRTKKGDSGDAALAKPIQQKLSSFQKANPSLGNLGPTDTVSNATINRASASPAALVEMGSMVAWEKQHGSNFTSTNKFDELATGIAEGVYQGGGFDNKIKPPTQQPRFQSLQGKDGNDDTKYLIVNQQAKPQITGQGSQNAPSFVSMGDGRWRTQNELSTTMRNLYLQKLGQ